MSTILDISCGRQTIARRGQKIKKKIMTIILTVNRGRKGKRRRRRKNKSL